MTDMGEGEDEKRMDGIEDNGMSPIRPEPPVEHLEHPAPPMGRHEAPRHPGPHPGPHGPRPGPHRGPHGPRPEPPIGPHRSIMETDGYKLMDTDAKVMALLRELGHIGRVGPDGRGGQGRVIRLLAKNGAMTPKELTERLGIQPASVSEVISKLESAGLVVRSQSDEDRRTVNIALTEDGMARAGEMKEQGESLLTPLSDEEREGLLSCLERMSLGLRGRKK